MKHQRHLRSPNAVREATEARTLIADLSRIVDMLNLDIASREEEAGSHRSYAPRIPRPRQSAESAPRQSAGNYFCTPAAIDSALTVGRT